MFTGRTIWSLTRGQTALFVEGRVSAKIHSLHHIGRDRRVSTSFAGKVCAPVVSDLLGCFLPLVSQRNLVPVLEEKVTRNEHR